MQLHHHKDVLQRVRERAQERIERTQRRKEKRDNAPFYALAATNAKESANRRASKGSSGG